MADTPTGETATPAEVKNDATPQSTPAPAPAPAPVKTEDNAVEELRKTLEQQTMRANQLANQLKAKEDADAAAEAKRLEDNEEFKSLYEQEKAKREAVEAEREQTEKVAELEKSKAEVLKDYSDEVKTLADEVGLSLVDTDETSINAFKEKLEKINTRVANTGNVTPNNPSLADTKFELTGEDLQRALADEGSFHDIVIKKYPGIAAQVTNRTVK